MPENMSKNINYIVIIICILIIIILFKINRKQYSKKQQTYVHSELTMYKYNSLLNTSPHKLVNIINLYQGILENTTNNNLIVYINSLLEILEYFYERDFNEEKREYILIKLGEFEIYDDDIEIINQIGEIVSNNVELLILAIKANYKIMISIETQIIINNEINNNTYLDMLHLSTDQINGLIDVYQHILQNRIKEKLQSNVGKKQVEKMTSNNVDINLVEYIKLIIDILTYFKNKDFSIKPKDKVHEQIHTFDTYNNIDMINEKIAMIISADPSLIVHVYEVTLDMNDTSDVSTEPSNFRKTITTLQQTSSQLKTSMGIKTTTQPTSTAMPTTAMPTTAIPSIPTTAIPAMPTTAMPTTAIPTTAIPSMPTTAIPSMPTTAMPTTAIPSMPTTAMPAANTGSIMI
jgi:hypothetical protein